MDAAAGASPSASPASVPLWGPGRQHGDLWEKGNGKAGWEVADPLAIIPLFNHVKYLWSTPSWQGPLEVSGPTPRQLTWRLNQAVWSLNWVRFEVLLGR